MAIPNYNGAAIFGPAPRMRPSAAPPRFQLNEYPGINGVEALFLGTSGGTTEIDGILIGDDLTQLVLQETAWRTYQASGIARTFVDTAGVAWPQVLVWEFRAAEGVTPGPNSGGVSRQYTATLLHLI